MLEISEKYVKNYETTPFNVSECVVEHQLLACSGNGTLHQPSRNNLFQYSAHSLYNISLSHYMARLTATERWMHPCNGIIIKEALRILVAGRSMSDVVGDCIRCKAVDLSV